MGSIRRRDRGRTPYFHGRREIINTFHRVLEDYLRGKEGTTFLIQGAPGAGKTALLDKLSTEAKMKGWAVAKIAMEDLYTPILMAQSLGEAYVIDSEIAVKVGIKIIEGGLAEHVAGHASPKEILKHLAPETGLVLVLDEAQHLIYLRQGTTEHNSARSTLDVIHNGDVGRPVMLLAAGLGTTEAALSTLGVSRFESDCTVQLGRMCKEAEYALIKKWLMEDGGVKGDPLPWIKSIAEQSHGWPQHIMSYVKAAAKYLESNNRRMTDDGLKFVLEKGTEYRETYYEKRAHDIDEELREALAVSVLDVPIDGTKTRSAIMASLKQSGLPQQEADKLFTQALEQGIIDKRKRGRYGIPIPSMHTWLVDEYARDKKRVKHTPVAHA